MYHEAAKIVKPKMDYLTVQTARYFALTKIRHNVCYSSSLGCIHSM